MRDYKLTKQALKKLSQIAKSNPKTAKQIKEAINKLSQNLINGNTLQGFSNFKKVRIGKFRLIYTVTQKGVLLIAIIEKRETVYQTFAHLMKNSQFLDI